MEFKHHSRLSMENLFGRPNHAAKHSLITAALVGLAVVTSGVFNAGAADSVEWSATDLLAIRSLAITNLPRLSKVPSNRVADDERAASFGKAMFFDTHFSANGAVSCATCHKPDRQFQDDLRKGHGVAEASRRTMPLAGAAFFPFLFWDGRKDSLWSQALGPLENPVEHGADRAMIAQLIATNYRADYEAVFGTLPDLNNLPAHAAPTGSPEAINAWKEMKTEQQQAVNLTFANMGKAIEAFERTIPVPSTLFDDYAAAVEAKDMVNANAIFNHTQRNGLRLFLDKGCMKCHLGPQFTDMQFHNNALPALTMSTDSGRISATNVLRNDPFNCLGEFSDAKLPFHCQPIKNMEFDLLAQTGAFKSPSLRGVAQRPPYMHDGQFATLHDVLVHYNNSPKASVGESELPGPRNLTLQQLDELEAFLLTLNVDDRQAK